MPDQFSGRVEIQNAAGGTTISLDGNTGNITAGGNGQDGDLLLRSTSGTTTIFFNGSAGSGIFGANGVDGEIFVRNSSGQTTITIDGGSGDITAGGNGQDGDLSLRSTAGTTTISFNGSAGSGTFGANGADGEIFVRNSSGQTTITIDGGSGNITAGGNGQDGDLTLRNTSGTDMITMDGQNANIWLGGRGADGDLVIMPASATTHTDTAQASIHLNGDSGDIILRNADCAEEFIVAAAEGVEPGTVMALDDDAKLRPSNRAYEAGVVGVISGAGSYKPGIILDRQDDSEDRRAVALMGKVYCKASASNGPIKVGDLLTTSDVRGHAMRASDPARAFGAVIGKSLGSLKEGEGLIPILIALQ